VLALLATGDDELNNETAKRSALKYLDEYCVTFIEAVDEIKHLTRYEHSHGQFDPNDTYGSGQDEKRDADLLFAVTALVAGWGHKLNTPIDISKAHRILGQYGLTFMKAACSIQHLIPKRLEDVVTNK
jgi:hypothetical protein